MGFAGRARTTCFFSSACTPPLDSFPISPFFVFAGSFAVACPTYRPRKESLTDAIILAAGLGTRLRPHTLTTPKPLLPIQDRPILDWILGALPCDVERLVVVVNYLAHQIEEYLRRQTHFAHWSVVRQLGPHGTGDALRSCRGKIEADRFLVRSGDDLY